MTSSGGGCSRRSAAPGTPALECAPSSRREGGKAAWQPVKVGSIVRDQAVIESGVSPGDRVVVVGHRDLAEGDLLLLAREGACCTHGRATF